MTLNLDDGRQIFYNIDTLDFDLESYRNNSPLITTVPSEDGVYTWILATCKDELKFFCLKSLSLTELDTKHSSLLSRIQKQCSRDQIPSIILHYAGELRKIESDIYVNFASGTYMNNDEFDGKLREDYFTELDNTLRQQFLPQNQESDSISISIKLTDNDVDTLLTEDFINVKLTDLELYAKYGSVVYMFNSKEECSGYNTLMRAYKKDVGRYEADTLKWDRNINENNHRFNQGDPPNPPNPPNHNFKITMLNSKSVSGGKPPKTHKSKRKCKSKNKNKNKNKNKSKSKKQKQKQKRSHSRKRLTGLKI
jgi:hypothetical protein